MSLLLLLLLLQVDCHSEGINFNEFIAAMFDAQKLAYQQQQQLVSVCTVPRRAAVLVTLQGMM